MSVREYDENDDRKCRKEMAEDYDFRREIPIIVD